MTRRNELREGNIAEDYRPISINEAKRDIIVASDDIDGNR